MAKELGIYLGLTSIIIILVNYLLEMQYDTVLRWLSFFSLIGFIIYGIQKQKEQASMLSLGQALKTGITITLVSTIISMTFFYCYTEFIDPYYYDDLLAKTQEEYAMNGYSENQIDAMMSFAEKLFNPNVSVIMGLVSSSTIGFIVSLISGAFYSSSFD